MDRVALCAMRALPSTVVMECGLRLIVVKVKWKLLMIKPDLCDIVMRISNTVTMGSIGTNLAVNVRSLERIFRRQRGRGDWLFNLL